MDTSSLLRGVGILGLLAALGACSDDKAASGDVRLLVKKLGSGSAPSGRLVVAWFQLNDDGPDPLPRVGLDLALGGSATTASFDLATVLAADEPNLLCRRACDDEAMCPCLDGPRIGIAEIIAIKDVNVDGKIGADEVTEANAYGVVQGIIVSSDKAYKPAPAGFELMFPQGIEAGVHVMKLVPRTDNATFKALAPAAADTTWELDVCPDQTCTVPWPELS